MSPSRRYWLRMSVLLVAGVALLGVGTRITSAMMARLTVPTGGAEWIWAERSRFDRSAAAFYAVRDFFLDDVPPRARLLVLADPEYILTLNGKRIGAGRYRPGAALDVYEAGDLLLPGGNRLLVELRSDHGAGGFLAALQDGDGNSLVRTDSDWRVIKRHSFGLVRGLLPLEPSGGMESEPAFSWGLPPTGRWGKPRLGPQRPRLLELIHGEAIAAERLPMPPVHGLPPTAVRYMALFDWGREVSGYLTLQMPAGDGLRKALLFTGDRMPDPLQDPPAGAVLAMTGRRLWMDAQPRHFRYALVIGDRPLGAKILPVDPRAAAGLFGDRAPKKMEGVFGLEPPPLRTPVQDEIWRELERVPGKPRRAS